MRIASTWKVLSSMRLTWIHSGRVVHCSNMEASKIIVGVSYNDAKEAKVIFWKPMARVSSQINSLLQYFTIQPITSSFRKSSVYNSVLSILILLIRIILNTPRHSPRGFHQPPGESFIHNGRQVGPLLHRDIPKYRLLPAPSAIE